MAALEHTVSVKNVNVDVGRFFRSRPTGAFMLFDSRVIYTCIAILACLLLANPIAAQDSLSQIVIGETLEIESQILEETRQIIIGKPASYDSSMEDYPVLYLLDGEEQFVHTAGLIAFLADNIRIPEILVVAIVNIDRTRDLTPPSRVAQTVDGNATYGGADNFLSFITNELKPWVERNYRTLPHSILVGHSFGGLFAIYAFFDEATEFDSYIVISPPLGWDDQRLISEAADFFDRTPQLDADLFLTAGDDVDSLLDGVRKLSAVLDEAAPRNLRWAFDHLPGESHQLVPHRSIHRGLEFIYSNYYLADPMTHFEEHGAQGLIDFYGQTNRRIPLITYANIANPLLDMNRLDDVATLLSLGPDAYDPSLPTVFFQGWMTLAGMYAAIDNEARAVEIYDMVLEANPANEQAREGLRDLGIDP